MLILDKTRDIIIWIHMLAKNGPVEKQSWIEERFKGPSPSLLKYLLMKDSGRKRFFSCVSIGDLTSFQIIVPILQSQK